MAATPDDLSDLLADAAREEWSPGGGSIEERSFARLMAADTSDLPRPGTVRVRDGLDLAYRVYPGSRDRALVLLHGSAGHGGHLHVLASALAQRGAATVVVPDMRGHGLSGRRRGGGVAYPEQMRDDIVDLIDALAGEIGRASIAVGGHSAGGGLALRLAASALADRIDGFLLLAPFFGAHSATTRPHIGGWASLNHPRIRSLIALNKRGITWLNELAVLEFNQPFRSRDGRETLAWSFNTMLAFGPGDWRSELAAIGERPLRVLVGDGDECFVPEAYGATLAEAVPQGRAGRVQVLDGLGHWDLLVAEQVAEAAAQWLTAP